MTKYTVSANGQRSTYTGLNAVADELVDQWLTKPDPAIRVDVLDNGLKRDLTDNEHVAVVRRLVALAQEWRAQQGPQAFSFGDLFGAAA